ncbi:hypothetical protein NDU88_000045 [Pleurodeles waltl]|uniref:C2H2-type domain-containing protein n=1 Tax=Pleurodeles waltl TaxID=8319 RepID=A0AAV7WI74_PLEWA|nr:hypothetical protein NDU88_000045 [Pleurodeles waltl]
MAQSGPFNGCEVRHCSARSKTKQTMVEPVEEIVQKTRPPHTYPQHGRQRPALEEISYICGECGRSFAGHSCFAEHQKSHKEKIYKCVECRQTYNHETALLRHLQSHTVPEPFQCTECRQCFGKNSDLLQHQQSHQVVTPCQCTELPLSQAESAAYQWKQSGEALELSPGGERPPRAQEERSHKSTLCAGSPSDAWHLHQHQRTDTARTHMHCPPGQQRFHDRAGVELHPCPHCKSSFRLKGSLALHMKIHRNQRNPDQHLGS